MNVDLHLRREQGQVLGISVADRQVDVHAMWLRDMCTCDRCRRPASNERLLDSSTIAPDLTIESARVESGMILVDTSDGHDVRVAIDSVAELVRTLGHRDNPASGRDLWDGGAADVPLRFDLRALDDDHERRRWLDELHRRGIAVVATPHGGERAVREVAELIGPRRPTNYGTAWTVDATIDPVTAVDSERALAVHTDLPYLDHPPGVQLMAVDNDGVQGGDSTFVDGYAASERIRTVDPDAWRLLTSVDFAYPFVRHDIEMRGRAPMVGVGRDYRYDVIRRAPDLVGGPFVDAVDTPALYDALGAWNRLLDGGDLRRQVCVGSGEVIVWDNHRLLHGRTGFELGSHGRRVLHGCYVDVDHLRSERALARRRTTA